MHLPHPIATIKPLYLPYLTLSEPDKMAGGDQDFPAALRDCVIDNIRIGKQIGRGGEWQDP